MDAQKVDMYLMANGKFFEGAAIPMLRESLLKADDSKFITLQTLNLKDPTTILIVSVVAGSLGIDRFLIGDTGLGIGKLMTCGGLGIWAIVDWFMIQPRTKELNLQKLNTIFI